MDINSNSLIFYGLLSFIPLMYWYFTRNFNYWSKRGIKGPKPIIWFGTEIYRLFTPMPELELNWYQKYGKVYGVFQTNNPMLTIADPVLIKTILVKDFHIFHDRRHVQNAHPVLRKALITAEGDDWKRIRSIASPAFSSGKMKKMYSKVKHCLNEFMDVLEINAKNRSDINVKDLFGNYTMDVIANCAFATKTNAHKDPNNPFIVNAKKTFTPSWRAVLTLLILPKWFASFSNKESPFEFFFNITRHIIKERKGSNNKYNDFVDILINAEKDSEINRDVNDINESHHVNEGEEELAIEKKVLNVNLKDKHLTEDEILAQAWIFFIAGYETTATTLTFCSYELALNPEVQEKLYEEVVTIIDSKGEIDYDLLAKLPYLDAVLSETLRLHSPVMKLSRRASSDYKLGDTGITIEKGTAVEFPTYAIHHSEEYYENAETFNPDRFLPENRHKITPYTYLPFGAGPRNCIGMRFALMEAKLALANIITKYKFFRSSQTEIPLTLNASLIRLKSAKRVIIGIEKRL